MKTVAGDIYLTRKDIKELPSFKRNLVKSILAKDVVKGIKFNLIKVDRYNNISLLSYPNLNSNPHPALKQSCKITNRGVVCREYKENPPILHRLETILPKDDPRIPKLRELTEKEMTKGLYDPEYIKQIGRQEYWNELVIQKELFESWSI